MVWKRVTSVGNAKCALRRTYFSVRARAQKNQRLKRHREKMGMGITFFSGYESAVQRDVVVGYLYLYAIQYDDSRCAMRIFVV